MPNETLSDNSLLTINCVNRYHNSVEISIIAQFNDLRIRGSGIISISDFEENLPQYRSFPLKDKVVIFSGGVWSDDGSRVDMEHIHISLNKIGNSGRLIMTVKLFEEDFEYASEGFGRGGRFDYHVEYTGLSELLDNIIMIFSGEMDSFTFSSFADW